MNWVIVLLLFDVQTGQLQSHTEQVLETEKQCTEMGERYTTNVDLPPNVKFSYVCLNKDLFTPPEPPEEEPKKKKFKIF